MLAIYTTASRFLDWLGRQPKDAELLKGLNKKP
jgi:hypothetical protein